MLKAFNLFRTRKLFNLKYTRLIKNNVKYFASEAVNIIPPASDDAKDYPPHIEKIVDDIAKLSLMEPAESMMMAPMSAAPVAQQQDEVEAAPAKTSYSVKLMKFDSATKVPLIKEIKNLVPEMNLVQAKKFVESAPEFLKRDVSKDEADAMKKALEAVGGSIEIE